jgi:DNA-binding MarR family transcriptional regulator
MVNRRTHVEEIIEATLSLRKGLSRIKASDITMSQWAVVAQVFHNPGCTINEAALALKMTGSAVTQLVNGLVDKGYVTRKPDAKDKRFIRLTLTASSAKKIDTLKKARVTMMLKLFKALSDKEFMQYVALHTKILASQK